MRKNKLLPVTIITTLLDIDDRLTAIEFLLKIKNKPFLVRTIKFRQPNALPKKRKP